MAGPISAAHQSWLRLLFLYALLSADPWSLALPPSHLRTLAVVLHGFMNVFNSHSGSY